MKFALLSWQTSLVEKVLQEGGLYDVFIELSKLAICVNFKYKTFNFVYQAK